MALGQVVFWSLCLGLLQVRETTAQEGLPMERAGTLGSRARGQEGPSDVLGISLGLSLGRERV